MYVCTISLLCVYVMSFLYTILYIVIYSIYTIYIGAGNTAAYMVFSKQHAVGDPRYTVVEGTELSYAVYFFITNTGADDEDTKVSLCVVYIYIHIYKCKCMYI